MWHRSATAIVLVLSFAVISLGQTSGVYSRAIPPDKAVLDRLNLKTEWTLNLPVEGRRDTIAMVQTFDDQLFVQTKTGLLGAIDARTGQVQWHANLGNGGYANVYPVAVNSKFVFATNVTKLFAFYRTTGVVEFVTDLMTSPMAGLAADDSGVYAILSSRAGSGGSQRLTAYDLPRPLSVVGSGRAGQPKTSNPVDTLIDRYPSGGAYRSNTPNANIEPPSKATLREVPGGSYSGSRTPSMAVLPKVTPPYHLEGSPTSPSLQPLMSLQQPYDLHHDFQRGMQRTASIGMIPPSVSAALALADLSPQGVKPPLRWEHGFESRVPYPPMVSPLRVWAVMESGGLIALRKADKVQEVAATLIDKVSAAPSQGGTIGYFPLADGNLVAIDLTRGDKVAVGHLWRVNVGGIMSRTPFVTNDAVYAAGDNSGVVRVDRETGDIVWRSSAAIDRVIAVNKEFAYLRDRQGRLLIFDARRATDPTNKTSVPLTGVNFSEFNVPVVNTVSDRIYLAADNGLLVCLRDASPKYARAMQMSPVVICNPPPKAEPKKDGMPPMTPPSPAPEAEKAP